MRPTSSSVAKSRSSRASSRAVVGDVVRQVLAGDLAAVLEYDYRLRRCAEDGTEPDPELIHRARVAARGALHGGVRRNEYLRGHLLPSKPEESDDAA